MSRFLGLLAISATLVFSSACGSGEVKDETAEKSDKELLVVEEEGFHKSEMPEKPAYAEKTIEDLSSLFSDSPALDDARFQKIVPAWKKLNALAQHQSLNLSSPDASDVKEFEKAIAEFGFKDWPELQRSLQVTSTCMMLLPMFEEMEKNDNKLASAMARELSSTLITQGKISKEDLEYVHNHWDEATEIMKMIEVE